MLRLTASLLRQPSASARLPTALSARLFCETSDSADVARKVDRIGTTWRNQDSLPVLPIQPLKDTLQRYREYLKPLLTEAEFLEANEEITQFENTSLASDLHSQLLELQDQEASWLEGFWDEMYLNIRDRLPINVNPYFSLDGQWKGRTANETASLVIHAACKFNKALKLRLLEPDMEGTKPLCMYQYSKLYGGTRYPRPTRDVFSSNRLARHIVVMRAGQMYTITVENEKQQLLAPPQIESQLDAMDSFSAAAAGNAEVGYFTCADREEWAANYVELRNQSERNKANLNLIDGALMVVNLDAAEHEELGVRANALLHNRGANRWFDKLQLVISADGYVGFNMEHTPIDGHTLVRVATEMHAYLSGTDPFPRHSLMEPAPKEEPAPAPIHLEFDMSPTLNTSLAKARSEFEAIADQTVTVPVIRDIGKRFMKKSGCSPDAFVQMAIQLAYYKAYGRFDSTYESALTKQFLHGRTETIRSVSDASKDYCASFSEETLSESGARLIEACKKQSEIAKTAKVGKGVDRHLFGLACLARQEKEDNPQFQIPRIFTSPYYAKYGSNIISTSNCGGEGVGLFGFGPVHPDGVGIGYLIQDESTRLTVTTTNGNAEAFAETVHEAVAAQCRAIRAYKE